MSLMDLIERYVAAHEKIADATAQLVAQTRMVPEGLDDLVPTGPRPEAAKETSPRSNTGTPPATTPADSNTGTPPATTPADSKPWDPYKSAPMRKYAMDKQAMLRAELKTVFGLEPGEKLNGAQLHAMLLEQAAARGIATWSDAHGTKPNPSLAVPQASPVPPVIPQVPQAAVLAEMPTVPQGGAPTVTLDMIRDALNALMVKGDAARAEGLRLLGDVGGVSRLTDAATGQQILPAEKFGPLYQAVVAAAGRF